MALLDGICLITGDGVGLSTDRSLFACAQGIDLPFRLGTRYMAAASITKETNANTVVVSENSVVRVFDDGELIAEIIPELWLLKPPRCAFNKPLYAAYKQRYDGH